MLLAIYILVVIICTTRLNIQKFYILLTCCFSVFYVDHRMNSYYFAIQHYSTRTEKMEGIVVMEGECLGP